MRATARALPLLERHQVEIDPYYNFLAQFHDKLASLFNSVIEQEVRPEMTQQVKTDFVMLVQCTFLFLSDEEKAFFCTAPY